MQRRSGRLLDRAPQPANRAAKEPPHRLAQAPARGGDGRLPLHPERLFQILQGMELDQTWGHELDKHGLSPWLCIAAAVCLRHRQKMGPSSSTDKRAFLAPLMSYYN